MVDVCNGIELEDRQYSSTCCVQLGIELNVEDTITRLNMRENVVRLTPLKLNLIFSVIVIYMNRKVLETYQNST